MITRDAGDGDGRVDAVPRAEIGGGCVAVSSVPGERARTNLALLYGGAGRGPMSRVLIGPPGRLRAAADGAEVSGF